VATVNRRALTLSAMSSLAVIVLVAAVPVSATAAPRPSLHKVQVQVDRLNRDAGTATEHYDDARVHFADANRRLTVVMHRLVAKQAEVDAMQSSVGQLAAAAYKSGGLDPTVQILLADDPEAFLQSAVALDQLGRQQAATLARVVAARQGLASARNDVTQQRARAGALSGQIASQKHSIEAKLVEAKQLLGTLKADQFAKYTAAVQAVATHSRTVASRSRTADLPTASDPGSNGPGSNDPGSNDPGSNDPGSNGPGSNGPGTDPTPAGPASGRASDAIKTAYAQLGNPYVYGAAGPGSFDCSGLTMFSWGSAGVSLPHSSAAQYSSLPHVAMADLQPGDLVFYYSPISHVAIYIGGGRIIHAPHPGLSVEIAPLHEMPLVGAARP
jgi:cell wall-associated NlpC family hydrolase